MQVMVVPDNVLFEENAGHDVRKLLLTDCQLHTILRLPIGTFTPYSPGVKANIIFFRKGLPTEEVWIYDLRTNIEKVNKGHPLTCDYFKDFEKCFQQKPRKESDRFKKFTKAEVEKRDYNLDIFWLKDESLEDSSNLPDPQELASEAVTHLETAMDSLNELVAKLSNGNNKT